MTPPPTRTEQGFTLVELLISATIGVVVLSLVLLSLSTFLRSSYDGVATGQANDKLALALTELRREVVAADIVYNPSVSTTSTTVPAGYYVRMLTTPNGGATLTCVQWRLMQTTATNKLGKLEKRSWPNGDPTASSGWEVVATRLTMTSVPFSLHTVRTLSDRVLDVTFVVRSTTSSKVTSPAISIKTSFTALDAEFYVPTAPQYCTPP